MESLPVPPEEYERLEDLYSLEMLDTLPEERFERYISLVRKTFDVPVALISLIDVKRQWFKACQGLALSETSRDVSFCAYTILSNQVLLIPDTLKDPRFANNIYVRGAPHIRFYAGHPLRGPRGYRVGSLCIIDFMPREMDEQDLEMLRELALVVESEVNDTVKSAKTE